MFPKDVSNIKSITYTDPDFEGQAILRIFSNTTGLQIGCEVAVVTNGHTFRHPRAVGSIVTIFLILGLAWLHPSLWPYMATIPFPTEPIMLMGRPFSLPLPFCTMSISLEYCPWTGPACWWPSGAFRLVWGDDIFRENAELDQPRQPKPWKSCAQQWIRPIGLRYLDHIQTKHQNSFLFSS